MKVIILASEELKEEVLALPARDAVHVQWLNEPVSQLGAADACIDLLFENTKERVDWLSQLNVPVVVVNSVVTTLKEIPAAFIRMNGWKTFVKRNTWEAAGETGKKKVEELFLGLGRQTEWTPDIPGFISSRVIASVINEAFLALSEQISTEPEIDTAMKLGTNYPYGPFEWGQKIGLHNVFALLEALGKQQNRYIPSPLLKQRILV